MNRSSELIRGDLLSILADNEFHSGEALGASLGVSRMAISNHIKGLSTLGLDIYSVKGKGYRLAKPIILLCAEEIRRNIDAPHDVSIEVLNVIDSTNQYLKSKSVVNNGHTCLAEAQTAGRGRYGRKWISPYAASLYLSMHWSFYDGYAALGGLSLAVGVAIVDALKRCEVYDVQLKWPNDVYAQGGKLAGVLVEVEGQIGSQCRAIIGIGLNVAMPNDVDEIGQPWVDLTQLKDQNIDRNQLAANLICELVSTLESFEKHGLQPFLNRWRALDLYLNKPVKLIIGQKIIYGISRGIDMSGAFLLETEEGVKAYHGGEISVRSL